MQFFPPMWVQTCNRSNNSLVKRHGALPSPRQGWRDSPNPLGTMQERRQHSHSSFMSMTYERNGRMGVDRLPGVDLANGVICPNAPGQIPQWGYQRPCSVKAAQ